MREKGQTEVAKTLETPVFSRGIEILTEKKKFCKTNGVIDYIVSDDINDTTLRENISWAYALSKKVDF